MKKKVVFSAAYAGMKTRLRAAGLRSVCEEARCPNAAECFSKGTVTFLVMGPACTRNCAFCSVSPAEGPLPPPAEKEIEEVLNAVRELELQHAVITSVTRDDLPDGGAGFLSLLVRTLKDAVPGLVVELLFPDFRGDRTALDLVLSSGCDVFNHNIETVRRLSPLLRPAASYDRSLGVLSAVAKRRPGPVKSGFMIGLGENRDEVRMLIRDLAGAGVTMLTIGQYFQPSRTHYPVVRLYKEEEFGEMAREAREAGIDRVAAGPFVRSSYRADEFFREGTRGN